MRSTVALLLVAIALLPACQNYDITFNDRIIIGAQPLFANYDVADPALEQCLRQQIIDRDVRAASQLTVLVCTNAGIESLAGLATFTGLEQLKLSENRIRNLVELGQLPELVNLELDGNQIVDSVPLSTLPKLEQLTLTVNSALQCSGLARFNERVTIKAPAHCQSS